MLFHVTRDSVISWSRDSWVGLEVRIKKGQIIKKILGNRILLDSFFEIDRYLTSLANILK